jgi:hypothetical protein
VRFPTTTTDTFSRIDRLTPNGVSGWSHFGAGRVNYWNEFEWALVLVDPSGNNGRQSGPHSNDGQIATQDAQDFWDQAALV